MIIKRAIIAAILFISAIVQATADDAAPVAVQLKAQSLPAITDKGYKGRATVTPYVEIEEAAELERFCSRWPRVVDAILIAFEEKPLDLKHLEQDLALRQGELQRHIEESIGTGIFHSLVLVPGTRLPGEGSELVDHPKASRDCQPIAYLPWSPHKRHERSLGKQIADNIEEMRKIHRQTAQEPFLDAATGSAGTETGNAEAAADGEQLEEPKRHFPIKAFPGAPKREAMDLSWLLLFAILFGLGGLMIMIGAYIGYHVAKIRRDRRRKERRLRKKDRRSGIERRTRQDGPPEGAEEQRQGDERRAAADRRVAKDRRLRSRRGGDEDDG